MYIKIHNPRPLAFKGNSKVEILLVKIFSLKQKLNQILPSTIEKAKIFSRQVNSLMSPSDYNF